jgi:hypothetical protein
VAPSARLYLPGAAQLSDGIVTDVTFRRLTLAR